MKKFLIPEEGQFYKANLHCHTTCSDGKMTPEEVKQHYTAHGYSVVAFTDHCILLPHHDLTDETFVALSGYETEQVAEDSEPVPRRRHCHTCYIALKKEQDTMPYYSPESIWGTGLTLKPQVKFNENHTFDDWKYGPDYTNKAIALAREQGFFVTYNHPDWSVESYPEYSRYTGMHAMEIMNYSTYTMGYQAYVPRVYDDLLRKGERLYCIATDDNHSNVDVCGGWTMIKAPKLEYEAITDALVRGNFYASFGPEIKALWLEDGVVHIETSPAKRIICTFPHRRAVIRTAADAPLTEAQFPIIPSDGYFRITVEDAESRCANTNAYFTDQVL